MSELSGAVEGPVDEAVLRRLVQEAGGNLGKVYGKRGKDHLLGQIKAYNHAARVSPWVVLMDFDREAECLPSYLKQVMPNPAPSLCFRLAVRSIEAWLLADRERFAAFFSINESIVPVNPEALPDPKRSLIELARRSRRRTIRESLVPRADSGRVVGPDYTSWMIEYVQDPHLGWRPGAAAKSSDSLTRAQACLRRLLGIAR